MDVFSEVEQDFNLQNPGAPYEPPKLILWKEYFEPTEEIKLSFFIDLVFEQVIILILIFLFILFLKKKNRIN